MHLLGCTVLFSVVLQAMVRQDGITTETLSFVEQLQFVCGESKIVSNTNNY